MASRPNFGEDLPLRRAAEWYWELLEPEVSASRIAEWQAWLRASRENRAAFRESTTRPTWSIRCKLLSISELRDRQKMTPDDIAPIGCTAANAKSRIVYWAIAASIAVVVIIGAASSGLILGLRSSNTSEVVSYATMMAERRDLQLTDGSTVALGAGHQLKYRGESLLYGIEDVSRYAERLVIAGASDSWIEGFSSPGGYVERRSIVCRSHFAVKCLRGYLAGAGSFFNRISAFGLFSV